MLIPIYVFTFAVSFVISFFVEMRLIPVLKKHAQQPIYEGGPSWHSKKSGTPTMGGIAFVTSTLITCSVATAFLFFDGRTLEATSLLCALTFSLANSAIGIFDDLTKLKHKQNAGLTPIQKLMLQSLVCIAFIYTRYLLFKDSTTLSFSFGDVELGFLYYPIVLIILLGITNCANLTDGVDGLASSVAFAASGVIFVITMSEAADAAILSCALLGGVLAFLIFNVHPAKIFMGDTGSLFLGAAVVSLGFSMENPTVFLPLYAVYIIEGASVIAQVIYFKITKKRLFKMAPLHHHLEKCGMSENSICILAITVTLIGSLLISLL